MVAAAAALAIANSRLASAYFAALHAYLGPLSVLHWINDALMAVFFLLVGLEIKRELLDGQLSTWPRRILPGIAALGGMVVPALIYVGLNAGNARDPARLGDPDGDRHRLCARRARAARPRVPASLKVFLTALAIIDDLGAVVIIALLHGRPVASRWLGARRRDARWPARRR